MPGTDAGGLAAAQTFYNAFGFVHLPAMLAPRAVEEIQAEASRMLAGADESGDVGIGSPIEQNERLFELLIAENPGLMRLNALLLGDDFIWTGSELNRSGAPPAGSPRLPPTPPPEHSWHADRPGVAECKIPRFKWMFYLSPTTASAGALRVIPGSHRQALHRQLRPLQAHHGLSTSEDPRWAEGTFGVRGPELACHPVEATPGDGVVLSGSVYHAVFGHQPGRTYLALKFCRRPRTSAERASLWRNYGGSEETIAYPFRPDSRFVHHRLDWVRALVQGLPELASLAQADHLSEPYPDADISAYRAAKEYRQTHAIESLWDQSGRAAPDQSKL
eukprot:SAG22_NODE_3_length_48349_cov_158.681180_29_plen_333_part_00